MNPLLDLVVDRNVLVCTGTGGVGKTTTAAVLALEAARRGRRSIVVTIDPAKRLADALGIAELGNTPTLIDGPWPGELWALMLDTKSTFDALVGAYAADDEQAGRILANRFYRNISGALSGTQEYMAGEKLYELHQSGAYDLVVVDTPPTRHALDFLDAPRRLTAFLDHRLYRILVAPTRVYLRALGMAAQAFLRTTSKLVGTEALDDALGFFSAFEGMEQGFRDRAAHVQALLADAGTAFVLVASARDDTIAEATFFADRLHELGLAVAALVVNRVHPRFGALSASTARARLGDVQGLPLAPLWRNLAELQEVADAEEATLHTLRERVAPAPVARVPYLAHDVHDLDTLAEVADHLFGEASG